MTLPLILQIQAEAMESKASLTDALSKAKIACVKLGLDDFGRWVDAELNGYREATKDEIPSYRVIFGRPERNNPYRGWQTLQFALSVFSLRVILQHCGRQKLLDLLHKLSRILSQVRRELRAAVDRVLK